MKAKGNNNDAGSRGTGLDSDDRSALEIKAVDSDDENIDAFERIVDRRHRSVVDELKRSFLLLNHMQMRHHHNGSSVQISAPANNNRSLWIDNGAEAYGRYIYSVHSLERQKAKTNGTLVSDEKLGGVRKFASSIGNLLKTKSNEIQSPKSNKEREINSISNHSAYDPSAYQSQCDNINGNSENSLLTNSDNDKEEPVFERPTTRQFERERRQAVREQTVRTKTFKQWNLADFTQGKSDYLEPRQRLESLRSLNSTPCNDVLSANDGKSCKKNKTGWSESFVPKGAHQLSIVYGPPFPQEFQSQWLLFHFVFAQSQEFCNNSNEFSKHSYSKQPIISGCLSPISDYSTNRSDYSRINNYYNHFVYMEPSHGLSVEGGGGVNNNWFDVHKIKEAVSHESIANISQTRHRWQQMVDENLQSNRSTTPASYRQTYSNRSTPVVMNKYNNYSNGNGTMEPRVLSPPVDQQRGGPANLNVYEKERLLFIAYIQSHPDVLASLGIIIPVHVKQKFPLVEHAKVELTEIGQSNGQHGYHDNEYYDLQSLRYGTEKSDLIIVPNGFKNGRYIKHSTPSAVSTTQRKIVRKQSNSEPPPPVAPFMTNGHNGSTIGGVKKCWKLAEWMEPPSPINKSTENLGENGVHQSNGHNPSNYRSTGESLIAREIRELREREEDLRKSRSELGLVTLDDVMDIWKYGPDDGQQPVLRSARSLDHLHIIVENGLQQHNGAELPKLQTRSGSMDHLHFAGNGDDDGRAYGIGQPSQNGHLTQNGGATLSRPSPKSAYEKFLISHSQNNKFAKTIPSDNETPRKQELNTIEARIEQELDELRQREDELRRQREAAGLVPTSGPSPAKDYSIGVLKIGQKMENGYGPSNGHSNGFDSKPVYAAVYELPPKMADPDDMLFPPVDEQQLNQMNDGWMNIGDNRVKL